MAKKKQHIDDFFKQRMKGSELPLDGSEWDRLSKELHKKKRRFGWWWLLLSGLLAALWFISSPILEGNKTGNTLAETPNETDKVQQMQVVDPVEESIAQQENRSGDKSQKIRHLDQQLAQSDQLANRIIKVSDTEPEPSTVKTGETEAPPTGSGSGFKHNQRQPDVFKITSLSLDAIPYLITRTSFFPIENGKIKPKKTAFDFHMPIYIGINGGFGASQQFTGGEQNYANYRASNESLGLDLHIGFKLRVRTERGLILGSGLNYQNSKQSLGSAFTAKPSLRIQLYDSIPFISLPGDTTWIPYNYRDTFLSENISNPGRSYLTLPLLIGKSFTLNSRMGIQVSMELQPKLLLSAAGSTIGTGLKALQHNVEQYRPFTLSGGLKVGLNYQLTNRYSLAFNIGTQIDLMNQSKISSFNQRFGQYTSEFTLYYRLR